jgi:hypothetical protein
MDLRELLERDGFLIIPSVLDDAECDAMVSGMWDYLEHITQKWERPIRREDETTWREFYKLFPKHSMLLQHFEIGHAQFSWDVRQNPKIVEIFQTLWEEDLLVSFDGASFHLPPEITGRGWHKNTWYHCDQSFARPDFECVQGYVTGVDVEEGDATLSLFKGSHKLHSAFKEAHGITDKKDWYKLNAEEQMFYNDCEIVNIQCPKGSVVLWDSRTIHCGIEARKGRANPKLRIITYLCYMPRSMATPANLKKKKQAFTDRRTTSHYPCKVKLFSKLPYTYGAPIPTCEPLPEPNLTELGKRLAGF